MRRIACSLFLLLAYSGFPAETYKKPPNEILDVLNAPASPIAVVSPTKDYMLLAEPMRYPPIADLAQPMLRLAGERINPVTNGPHGAAHDGIAGGPEDHGRDRRWKVARARQERRARATPEFKAPTGSGSSFAVVAPGGGASSGLADTATAKARSARYGAAQYRFWGRDPGGCRTVVTLLVPYSFPRARGKVARRIASCQPAPVIQESYGQGRRPSWTLQDLLKNPADEDSVRLLRLQAQLAYIDSATGTHARRQAGSRTRDRLPRARRPAHARRPRIHRPYSYLYPIRDVSERGRDLGPDRQGRAQGREPAAGRRGADRRRAHRAARHRGGGPANRPRWCGWRRSTAAT